MRLRPPCLANEQVRIQTYITLYKHQQNAPMIVLKPPLPHAITVMSNRMLADPTHASNYLAVTGGALARAVSTLLRTENTTCHAPLLTFKQPSNTISS
jgi:hypothetical protein